MGNPNHFMLNRAPGGYYKDEVISALQKAAWRSDERLAVYWATVLDLEGGNIAEQLWKRMLIMANEDIGPADSSVIVKIKTLYDCWRGDEDEKPFGDRRLCVIHAALILARAPKSRTCDNLASVLYDQGARPKLDVPDYALDKHTQRGYEKRRGWDHFITEGSKLIQPDPALIERADRLYQTQAESVLLTGRKPIKESIFNRYALEEKPLPDPDEEELPPATDKDVTSMF